MKKNIVTIGVAVLILAGVVALNRFEPQRVAERGMQEAQEAQALLEQAAALEAEEQARAEAEKVREESGADAAAVDGAAFKVAFECSNGTFVVECHPSWAPLGAARFRALVKRGFYDGCRFFRVVPTFIAQFGIPGDPELTAQWNRATLQDEPVLQTNTYGMVSFATGGKNTRTTQVFVSLRDNAYLDELGFSPFGRVVEGMEVIETINGQYGETPSQKILEARGNAYLDEQFPDLDYIVRARIIEEDGA